MDVNMNIETIQHYTINAISAYDH